MRNIVDTDTNNPIVNKFTPGEESLISAFDQYLVPICDDYGYEVVASAIAEAQLITQIVGE